MANTHDGTIGGCKVIDDVNTTSGALVGTNYGLIYASYCTGETGTTTLIGSNSGQVVGCYQSTDLTALDEASLEAKVKTLNNDLGDLYKNNTSLTQYEYIYSPGNYPSVKKK